MQNVLKYSPRELRYWAVGLLSASTCLSGPLVLGHDDVRPKVVANKIVTDGYDDATLTNTPDVRVFGYDLGEDDPVNDPYFAGDPGFSATSASGFTDGTNLVFTLLSGSPLGLSSTLTYWDGTGSPNFAAVPSSETLRLNLGSQNRTAGGGNLDVAGFSLGTHDALSPLHTHLSSFLQGADGNSDPLDGNNPADGIYLLALSLGTNMPGVADSEPIFIVYNAGLSEELHDAAIEFVSTSYVPEPSAIVLLTIGGVGLVWAARRRRPVKTSVSVGRAATQ